MHPCGHPADAFADVVARCTRVGCTRPPRFIVLSIGRGVADVLCWRINPTCRRHRRQERRLAEHDSEPAAGFGVVTWRASAVEVVEWLHADPAGCGLPCISTATPSTGEAGGGG
jgi:hypothetical protein